jgi:hypothetical protein
MDFRLVDKTMVDPSLLRFAQFCDDLAGNAPMPRRERFRIRDATWLFGYLKVADVLGGGRDFRYSYVGDFWHTMLNYDLTGARLSELEACGMMTNVRTNYDAALKAHAPRYRFGRWVRPNRRFIRTERLLVPFTDDGETVSMLVIAVHCKKAYSEILEEVRDAGPARLELEFSQTVKQAA